MLLFGRKLFGREPTSEPAEELPVRDGEWRGFCPYNQPNPQPRLCYTWTQGTWRCYRGGEEGFGTLQLTMRNGKLVSPKWVETGTVCPCGMCVIWSDGGCWVHTDLLPGFDYRIHQANECTPLAASPPRNGAVEMAYRFDPSRCYNNIKRSNDDTAAEAVGGDKYDDRVGKLEYRSVLLKPPISEQAVATVTFKLNSTNPLNAVYGYGRFWGSSKPGNSHSNGVHIGVCSGEHLLPGQKRGNGRVACGRSDSFMYRGRDSSKRVGGTWIDWQEEMRPLLNGDTITLQVDRPRRTLHVQRNGKMLGLLSGDLPAQGELFFVVDLEVHGQRVELVGGDGAPLPSTHPQADWDSPIELTVNSNHAMHSNGPIRHILECHTSNFANFDAGGRPWWVVFDAGKPQGVGGLEMAAYVTEESPKVVELLASDDLASWILVATLSTPAPWGTGAGPRQWPVDTPRVARYWKINVTATHNGVAPTIHYCKLVAPSKDANVEQDEGSAIAEECRHKLVAIVEHMNEWPEVFVAGTRELAATKTDVELCQAFVDFHSSDIEGAQFSGISNGAKGLLVTRLIGMEFASQVRARLAELEKDSEGEVGTEPANLAGTYFSFPKGGDPSSVVDRFEARMHGATVTFYRNNHPGESYKIRGNTLHGAVTATVEANGDISWSHGYISRKEGTGGGGNRGAGVERNIVGDWVCGQDGGNVGEKTHIAASGSTFRCTPGVGNGNPAYPATLKVRADGEIAFEGDNGYRTMGRYKPDIDEIHWDDSDRYVRIADSKRTALQSESMAPPPMALPAPPTEKERAEQRERVLNMLHPPGSAQVAAPAALDAEMTDTVKTVAERSGMDAEAIAAMFSLDVAAVRAVLTPQLEPQMADTVKTIAKQSGMDAAAIAAMLSLDVDAVGAALAAP